MLDIPQEKQTIINAIRARNNVCVTGAAGTGKSFVLEMVKTHFPYVHITASTGVSAVNVGGVTIHSWAGIGNASLPVEEIVRFINSGPGTKIRRQLKKAKLLAIDEISMISASVFNLINQVFQKVRQNELPFGGIQILVLGDFFQLPPVSKDQVVEFCFSSSAWYDAEFKIFELNEVFRQSDLRFIQLLNNIRHAALNDEDIELLRQRECSHPENLKPTLLVTHNYQADKINIEMLNKLVGEEERKFKMKEQGKDTSVAFLKKSCLAPQELVLKRGAQVMMLKNSLQKQGIINGSIGIVTGFTKNDSPIVKFLNGEVCVIGPEDWNIEAFNETTQEIELVASIKQIPLALAWAITIHKSQGMTLDYVLCDLSQVFAEGQAYVALSRVRSLDGLFIKGFKPGLLKVSPMVREFYSTSF
jgi:ATP-dependent exoDNAse (exonuclease V) alpha subunit